MTILCMLNRTSLCLYLSAAFPLFPAMSDHVDLLVWPTMVSKVLSAVLLHHQFCIYGLDFPVFGKKWCISLSLAGFEHSSSLEARIRFYK